MHITYKNHDQIINAIVRPYHKYIQFNMPKIKNSYQRTNPAILWFLNITSCQHPIILAFFIYKIIFDAKISCKYYDNNCMYNRGNVGQLLIFETYNMTARLGIIYVGIAKYSNLLFSSKRKRLLTKNPPWDSRIAFD